MEFLSPDFFVYTLNYLGEKKSVVRAQHGPGLEVNGTGHERINNAAWLGCIPTSNIQTAHTRHTCAIYVNVI